MSAMLRQYGVETTIIFPIPKVDDTAFAGTADWTPATGDTKVSKNGGNVANTTNNPAAVGGTGSVLWSLTLTAAEMQAARVVAQIVDAAVENQAIVIETYGHASAQHPAFPATDSAGAELATAAAVAAAQTDLDTITDSGVNLKSTGLDAISATPENGVPTTFRGKLLAVFARFYHRVLRDSDEIKVYRADATTVNTTQTYTSVDPDEDIGAAS